MNDDLISRKSIMDKLYAKANEWRGSYTGDAYGTVYSRHLNPSILPAVKEELKYMEEHHDEP